MKILGMEMEELSQQLQNRIKGNFGRMVDERMFKMLLEMLEEKGILDLDDREKMEKEVLRLTKERDKMCREAHLSFSAEMENIRKGEENSLDK